MKKKFSCDSLWGSEGDWENKTYCYSRQSWRTQHGLGSSFYVYRLSMCFPQQRNSTIYIIYTNTKIQQCIKIQKLKIKKDLWINQTLTPPEANRCVLFRLISTLTCEWASKLVMYRVCHIRSQRSAASFSRTSQLWNIADLISYSFIQMPSIE